MDMYIEKIFLMKIYRGDQKALDKIGFKKNCAEDLTANQKCRIKVRAVGLDYEIVTKWLELPEQVEAISIVNRVNAGHALSEAETQQAIDFVAQLRQRLTDTKTDKMLIRLINQHLQAFGPGKTGPNLLINKYMPIEQSLLYKVDALRNEEAKAVAEGKAAQKRKEEDA